MTDRFRDEIICRHCGKAYLAITVSHLRYRHSYIGEHPVNDYKRRYNLKFAKCTQTRRRHSRYMVGVVTARGQRWTRKRLLTEIRRAHRAGEGLSVTVAPIKWCRAAERLFGSWRSAVEAAGLNYDELLLLHRWSRQRIVEEIHELARQGTPLDRSHIRRRHSALFHSAVVWFPSSWGKALRAAGFDPAQHKKSRGCWDRRKAAEWVRQRVKHGRSILARDVPSDLRRYAQYKFESGWTGFVESLGIVYPGKRLRHWSKNLVLQEIRRLTTAGQAMHSSAVKRVDDALVRQARKYFKSWDAARAAAKRAR